MSESNARVETTWSGPEIKPVPAWYFDIVPVVWLETHPGIYLLAPQPSSPVRAPDLRLSDPPSLANNAEFPYFSRLPAEIRCQIWELALPGPRIVKVRSYAKAIWRGPPYFNVQQNRNGKNVGKCIYSLFRSPSKPPTILFVNQESRAEARKHYQLTFGFNHPLLPSTIWFNFKQDTLYFEFTRWRCNYCEFSLFNPLQDHVRYMRNGIKNVERVAISHRAMSSYPNAEIHMRQCAQALEGFEQIQELFIAVERNWNGKGEAVSNNARFQCYDDLDDDTYFFGSPDIQDQIDHGRKRIHLNRILSMWHRIFKDMLWASAPAVRMMEIFNEDCGSVDVDEEHVREKDVGEGQVAVKEEKIDLD